MQITITNINSTYILQQIHFDHMQQECACCVCRFFFNYYDVFWYFVLLSAKR